jgi:alpha-L-fucosidase
MARKTDALKWWREARFGMFIHWGLYAVPAGIWKGKEIPGIGEWIMNRAKIPIREYEKLAGQFNPRKFDAKKVVQLAKEAGMKYLVITAKHHDGFAMFKSPSSKYNIVDFTPYKKDPMKALASECKKARIKMCFYYSQYQDWHHPNGARNYWDYDEEKKDLDQYIKEKVKPQLRELLTQYGPIGLIWFDTPGKMTAKQSMDLRRFVHRLQPKCLVSGRVGNDLGDYGSLGDNEIPRGRVTGDWETPATLNDTWGFKRKDHEWKTTKSLIELMAELAGKGVNYLLNIGPTAEGVVPGPSVQRLREVGKWMKANGEAVYGTTASPYPYDFPWGFVTAKKGKLYLLVTKWEGGRFTLYGLKNKVKGARTLADGKALEVRQSMHRTLRTPVLEMDLPKKAPDRNVSVIVLDIVGNAAVDESLTQRPDGVIHLPAHMATLQPARRSRLLRIGRAGCTESWEKTSEWLVWRFKAAEPGRYGVKVVTRARRAEWEGRHTMKVILERQTLKRRLSGEEPIINDATRYHAEAASKLGTVTIAKAGKMELALKAAKVDKVAKSVRVVAVELVPTRR